MHPASRWRGLAPAAFLFALNVSTRLPAGLREHLLGLTLARFYRIALAGGTDASR